MNAPPRPLIHSYRPRSFRERGLCAPFTSPLLSGARLRQAIPAVSYAGERSALRAVMEGALELIVPNPSGGKGVYILPWGDIGAIWRPTMHDVELGRVLATMLDEGALQFTPYAVREAARQVAARGLAGRGAAQAAERAAQAQADGLMATRFTLLMRVTEQIEERTPGRREPMEQASPADIQQRGGLALRQLAANLGHPAHLVDARLDTLALHFVDIGVGMGAAEASLSRLVADLGRLHHALMAWAQTEAMIGGDDTSASCRDAQGVATAAELVSRMAAALLDAARERVCDMATLIRSTLATPGEIAAMCERPALLLDGWQQICLLWKHASARQPRHATLREIVRQMPLLPDEAEGWLGLPAGTAGRLFQSGTASTPLARGDHAGLAVIARNEQLRAMAG